MFHAFADYHNQMSFLNISLNILDSYLKLIKPIKEEFLVTICASKLNLKLARSYRLYEANITWCVFIYVYVCNVYKCVMRVYIYI